MFRLLRVAGPALGAIHAVQQGSNGGVVLAEGRDNPTKGREKSKSTSADTRYSGHTKSNLHNDSGIKGTTLGGTKSGDPISKEKEFVGTLEEIHQGIEDVSSTIIEKVKNDDIVVFLGNTRAGKSTVVNYAIGNGLRAVKKGKDIVIEKSDSSPGPEISASKKSESTVPTKWPSTNIKKAKIWDAGGFGDNRGTAQDIINAFCIKELLTNAKSAKFVLVTDGNDILDQNVSKFTDFLESVVSMLPNLEECIDGIAVVFTKIGLTRTGLPVDRQMLIDELQTVLDSGIELSSGAKMLINHFIHHNNTNVGIFKQPLKEGPILPDLDDNMLETIENSSPIEKEMLSNVSPSISSNSRNFLYSVREGLCDMQDFENLLIMAEGIYVRKLQSLREAIRDGELTRENIISIEANILSIERQLTSVVNIESTSLYDMLQSLSSIDALTKAFLEEHKDLLVKAKYIKFVDQTLKLNESGVFALKLNKAVSGITKEMDKLRLEIGEKKGEITMAEKEKLLSETDAKYLEKQKSLEKEIQDLKATNTQKANQGVTDHLGEAAKHIIQAGGAAVTKVKDAAKDVGQVVLDGTKAAVAKTAEGLVVKGLEAALSAAAGATCVVSYVTEVKHANPLLDKPALVQSFSHKYGILAASRLIDLIGELCQDSKETVSEICADSNAEAMFAMLLGISAEIA